MELLAELQHYGAATCLIDFTTSALIALWFACREETDIAGKVVAMATDDFRKFSTTSYKDLNKPVKDFLNQGKLWKWEPSGLNNRIVAQQSVFVFGEGRIEESHYEVFTIAAASKKDIIETLERSLGINEQKLFNDLAGFAQINAHGQPYDRLSAEDFFDLGTAFYQQGEYKQAIERYDRAIKLNPKNTDAYNNRGAAKNDSGDYQGAIADYDKVIELNPKDAMAYSNRGAAKLALGDNQEAIANFNIAIELNPKYPTAYYNRGIALCESGDFQGAIADFNIAIELNPKYATAYSNRGYAKHESGDSQEAIADHNEAIKLNPNYATAYYNRGIAKRTLGDEAGAKKDFDRASEIDPSLQPPES